MSEPTHITVPSQIISREFALKLRERLLRKQALVHAGIEEYSDEDVFIATTLDSVWQQLGSIK